jgi:glucose/arabinose dehydrogenase
MYLTKRNNYLDIVFKIMLHVVFPIKFDLKCVSILSISMFLFVISAIIGFYHNDVSAQKVADEMPILNDSNLELETIFQGEMKHKGGTLSSITTMAFLDENNILVLNKNNGTVNKISNGVLSKESLLDVNVANKRERGMLGIAVLPPKTSDSGADRVVYLYYTESEKVDGSDICRKTYYCKSDSETIGNNLYRYDLKENKLINPKLLLTLPSWPAPAHNGGIIELGPDGNLYVTIGDLVGSENISSRTKAQNYENGTDPDGRGGILRLTQEGKPLNDGILGNEFPLNLYFAYGIRNSFGIDFDPITGNLWDTENGPDYGDEINLVKPGFNSGWHKLQGIWIPRYDEVRGGDLVAGDELLNPTDNYFVDFNGNGKYSSPEFTWNDTVGPTAIRFLDSDKYPVQYKDDLFVGDTNNGYLYHFDLNKDRTSLKLNNILQDKVANDNKELQKVTIGTGFGMITDMEIGPDGYLYILSEHDNMVRIFKVVSAEAREN